ncbi:hypothetical protein [Rhodanobacter sp. DHB23]|uniref:hypothetical protein n=1 Tax=Rhodanobacter sp. DHB23 TaxID=2775923 RepID=UPI0017810F21|nr:hypothetical protein [Rhodanobacter sp. DHB23]MBD8872454.1 hypothetical protein [Rhodanobacter sp. DHB23]
MSRTTLSKRLRLAGLSAMIIFGIITPSMLLIWQACTPLVVVQKLDLGTFVSSVDSSIQTTLGTVTVKGAISALRGQKMSIEVFNKIDGPQLCVDGDFQSCMPLASPWLGSLEHTPQAVTVTDFQRYGFCTGNVEAWFWTGVLLTLLYSVLAFLNESFP